MDKNSLSLGDYTLADIYLVNINWSQNLEQPGIHSTGLLKLSNTCSVPAANVSG